MAFFRNGEIVTITKLIPAGSAALVESDYSLVLRGSGLTKIIPDEDINFIIVQPTESTVGSITCVFAVNSWGDGNQTFELHQILPGVGTWTRRIGAARVKVEKVPVPVIYV